MTIYLGTITPRAKRLKSSATGTLIADYVERAGHYCPLELLHFADEASLFAWVGKTKGRTGCFVVLLDSTGTQMASREIADLLSRLQNEGQQKLLLAIGPASGWSAESRKSAHLLLSLGRITMPHELAAAVLAEQVYRALTITAGHPYHCGH